MSCQQMEVGIMTNEPRTLPSRQNEDGNSMNDVRDDGLAEEPSTDERTTEMNILNRIAELVTKFSFYVQVEEERTSSPKSKANTRDAEVILK